MTDEEHDDVLLDADEFETEILKLIKTVDIDWMSVFIAAINIAGLALVEAQLTHDKQQDLAEETASFLKTVDRQGSLQ